VVRISKKTTLRYIFITANINSYMFRLYQAAIIRLYVSEMYKKRKIVQL